MTPPLPGQQPDRAPTPRPAPLTAAPSLLLAEADETIAEQVTRGLTAAGIEVTLCRDGAEALLRAGLYHPAMVLLGAPLPVVDAARVTQLLTQLSPVPVVIGVGSDHAQEAVAALAAGAVALVARPYRITEILPLLHPPSPAGDGSAEPLTVGDIEIDPAGLHVHVKGQLVRLPLREFQLLRYLMENSNRVVSRQQIQRELWGVDATDTNTLTVHVKRLREKVMGVEGSCCTIDTVRGMGYRLECPNATRASRTDGA